MTDSCNCSSCEVLSSYFDSAWEKESLLLGTINVHFILPVDSEVLCNIYLHWVSVWGKKLCFSCKKVKMWCFLFHIIWYIKSQVSLQLPTLKHEYEKVLCILLFRYCFPTCMKINYFSVLCSWKQRGGWWIFIPRNGWFRVGWWRGWPWLQPC